MKKLNQRELVDLYQRFKEARENQLESTKDSMHKRTKYSRTKSKQSNTVFRYPQRMFCFCTFEILLLEFTNTMRVRV